MIQLDNIKKVFQTEEVETWALRNISLQVKEGEFDLSPEKIARFKKNLAKLEQYHEAMPTEGVVIRYHGRVYKLTATFGAINQLVNIIKYR